MRIHGTRASYIQDGCRCEPCTTVSREYKRAWRAARRANDAESVSPGYVFKPRIRERETLKISRAEWKERATCREMDTDLFYNSRATNYVRTVCWRCPVRLECLESALTEDRFGPALGVRGGMDGPERRIEARRRGIFSEIEAVLR